VALLRLVGRSSVFLAASDTISILLGYALFLLARKPSVWHNLYTIVLEIGSQPLTYDIFLIQSFLPFRYVLLDIIGCKGQVGTYFAPPCTKFSL